MAGPLVVVGASAAALGVVEGARDTGYGGEVVVLGDETHLPYDRPPLSKQLLTGAWPVERLALRGPEQWRSLGVDLRLGTRATALDLAARRVDTDTGRPVTYEQLVIATGVRARRLAGAGDLAGVHVLRSLDDALGLQADLVPGARLAVVGAGVLGLEAAAVARGLGVSVTVVDPLARPMQRVVAPPVAHLLADLHRERGAELRLGCGVTEVLRSGDRVAGLVLDDGSEVPADVVLIAIGADPATDWLAGSGVPLDAAGAVLADEHGAVGPGVHSAGDVAAWWDPEDRCHRRVEHRLNATEQGRTVARRLVAPDGPAPRPGVPYFWSDQYDLKLQSWGHVDPDDDLEVVEGSLADHRFVAVGVRAGRVRSVVGIGMARSMRTWRDAVAAREPFRSAVATTGG